jgi:hypothetical protein
MTWAMLLAASDAASLGPLRRERGLEACLVDGQLWLRGSTVDDALALRLRQLPALERYTVCEPERVSVRSTPALVAEGTIVPRGYLPEGKWLPLDCWLPLTRPAPQSVTASSALDVIPFALVRDDVLREPNLLITSLATWSDYAARAPLVRLQRWSFAANDRDEALIRGLPLPPLPGRQLVEREGVAVEAGWTWSPAVDAAVLRRKLRATANDLLLLQSDEAKQMFAQIIPANAFVKTTRSAVRLTRSGVSM